MRARRDEDVAPRDGCYVEEGDHERRGEEHVGARWGVGGGGGGSGREGGVGGGDGAEGAGGGVGGWFVGHWERGEVGEDGAGVGVGAGIIVLEGGV